MVNAPRGAATVALFRWPAGQRTPRLIVVVLPDPANDITGTPLFADVAD